MRAIFLSCAAATLLFSACKKSDNSNGGNSAILSSGKWQMIAHTSQTITNNVPGTVNDVYSSLPSCEKDDYLIFSSSSYIITDEGATKCDASAPQQTQQGTWTLMNNGTKLRQSMPIGILDWEIDQLDNNTLKLRVTEVNVNSGGTVTYENKHTYKHVN